MKFIEKYSQVFRYILPNPLTIAILLTIVTFFIAFGFTNPNSSTSHLSELLGYWESGLWNNNLIVFAFQMMLMLVLGHILALTSIASKAITFMCNYATTNAKAAALVTFFTIIVSLFNWGLGLIFGAIFSRKVGEFARRNDIKLNYPLIGAAGYSGLMVWHGGMSGSSLIKVAEEGHLASMLTNVLQEDHLKALPDSITFSETVFSTMNICATLLIVMILPLCMYIIALKTGTTTPLDRLKNTEEVKEQDERTIQGAEHLDHSKWFIKLFGLIIFSWIAYQTLTSSKLDTLGFITPNYINFGLLGLCFLLHDNILSLLKAGEDAISGTLGILIQFPLYFGIMGIMKGSGLVNHLSSFFVDISNATTLPIFTLLSAGIVNIFVPSGGGQWAIQGPIIIQAAGEMNVSLSKCILALAYGDQLTNMLQPFWALPLLGITKLKAKEILPYTLFLMCIGGVIYISTLLLF